MRIYEEIINDGDVKSMFIHASCTQKFNNRNMFYHARICIKVQANNSDKV